MNSHKFTIVTVCRNALEGLQRTVRSVLSQVDVEFEYIIIDGASTDGTRQYLTQITDSRCSWISEPDDGIYNAINKGISRSSGDWVHILNAGDVYADSAALVHAIPLLDPDLFNHAGVTVQSNDGARRKLGSRLVHPRLALYYKCAIPHPGVIISSNQYRVVGDYREDLSIASDYDFILRMARRYPMNKIDSELVIMEAGGISDKMFSLSVSEAEAVSVENGMNAILAAAVRRAKLFNRRIRHGK